MWRIANPPQVANLPYKSYDGYPCTRFAWPCQKASRNSRLMILPVPVFGRAVALNRNRRGILNLAIRCRRNSQSCSSLSSVLGSGVIVRPSFRDAIATPVSSSNRLPGSGTGALVAGASPEN